MLAMHVKGLGILGDSAAFTSTRPTPEVVSLACHFCNYLTFPYIIHSSTHDWTVVSIDKCLFKEQLLFGSWRGLWESAMPREAFS